MAGKQVEIPRRPSKMVITMEHSPGRRLDRRMNCQRHPAILRRGEQPVMRQVAMGPAGDGERRYESAFAAVFYCAFKLARRLLRVAQRQMSNWHEPSARVAAEIRNPAIVGAAVGPR